MSQFNEVLQPIICDAYAKPSHHWVIEKGKPPVKAQGRREACYYYRPPGRSTGTNQADEVGTRILLDLVNEIRDRVKSWRRTGFPGVTGVTGELLAYWNRDDRERRLFFCQREAVETIIFLTEARGDFLHGLSIPRDEPGEIVRYACKMATGSGKTAVMGMLAAWSILNKVADRTDKRFSDVVLVLCPNVTIRERLQELDPHRGEASIYRARDLVPSHRMSDLRKGHVLIRNWHVLAPQEMNQVGGVGAKVVNRGDESDTALVSRVLGRGVGGKGNILILNDEAHHAYRIRQLDNTAELEEEDELAEPDGREATVWIEGLDKIRRIRGINLCVDLSATPFYLNRSKNDAGRPFPWIVSDFGLIDAIESGLVKIPQLPVQDTTGAEIPAYFNVWKWIVEKKLTPGEKGGKKGQVKPEAVLKWAQSPIAQLAGLWREKFIDWEREAREGKRPFVPPVFIIVCKDTRLAKVVYEWITAEGEGTAPPIEEFRNREEQEYTVRIDSRVAEEISSGVAKSDESRRLRFVLDTIGKIAWPGGEIPAEYLELTEKLNRKAIEEGGRRIDPRIPPGRDVRCIVSVAMLTEGWDATTVTHIVGLRPFDSQLLCEQVVGRGLRRSQYYDLTVEEVAKVYGVPFELIPLKTPDKGRPAPPPKIRHVHALSPERDDLEIRFPRVEGYAYRIRRQITVAWERMPVLIVDPMKIPDETKVKGLSTEEGGRLSLMGPGKTEQVTLQPWREPKRIQELEFDLARALTRQYANSPACEVPPHALFPQMLGVVKHFLREKVQPVGRTDRKDVFLEPYYSEAMNMLAEAIVPDNADSPELPHYEAHRGEGSTRDVDFWTSKPGRECERSHLNWVVADTEKWEQTAAFYLDSDKHVVAFVKNFNLGFAIPYSHNGEAKEYLPDFLVRLQRDGSEAGTLVLETKGYDPLTAAKEAGARRWVAAINADGSHGQWAYRLIRFPTDTPEAIRSAVEELVGSEE
ncbi:restriction endonuclease [Candidatus Methylomirabilis lanthanidiphila]|uniref:Restriction endonuclease n=1 Tax=Candidatus Methylomirabilis lanthanidiphila TaxID=2211376 RepID=A0A564ZLN9_9BACT|nr:DEAD/DEAH box helicase family protein [Candidatus Methylomirabilis lanthanidiphila]VUZ85777.1 restriction endonuclease [Candidatus Methylomirabilis lanthanidiphila]